MHFISKRSMLTAVLYLFFHVCLMRGSSTKDLTACFVSFVISVDHGGSNSIIWTGSITAVNRASPSTQLRHAPGETFFIVFFETALLLRSILHLFYHDLSLLHTFYVDQYYTVCDAPNLYGLINAKCCQEATKSLAGST